MGVWGGPVSFLLRSQELHPQHWRAEKSLNRTWHRKTESESDFASIGHAASHQPLALSEPQSPQVHI